MICLCSNVLVMNIGCHKLSEKVHLDGMTKVTIAYLHYDNNQSTFIDAQLSATCMTTMACNCHSMKQFSRVT